MAVLRSNDIKKLSRQQAVEKLAELEKAMLELGGEGKLERRRPLKQAIARLRTYLHKFELDETKKMHTAA